MPVLLVFIWFVHDKHCGDQNSSVMLLVHISELSVYTGTMVCLTTDFCLSSCKENVANQMCFCLFLSCFFLLLSGILYSENIYSSLKFDHFEMLKRM